MAEKPRQQVGGQPEGGKFFELQQFEGLNTRAARQAIGDNEFFWIENMFPVGPANLRAMYGKGMDTYIAPSGKTVVWFFHYVLLGVPYIAIFLSDGTAVQVNLDTNAQTSISATTGKFYNGTFLPDAVQWGSQYLLIISRNSTDPNTTEDGYAVWDGSLLYTAGTVGPIITVTANGENYTSAPTVSFYGGSGTGAAATATVLNSGVIRITVTNPGTGYLRNETVGIAFSGGGSNSTATATSALTGDHVTSITLVSAGSGYTFPPTVALTGGGGSGATATAKLTATTVDHINVVAGGSGYTSAPTVAIAGGDGTGATATATVINGVVASVAITAPGSGFTNQPVVTFTGGGGSGAAGTAVLTGTTVASVVVTAQGSFYITAPTVVFSGGGNQAANATALLMPFGVSGNAIETFTSHVFITNFSVIVFSDPGDFVNFNPSIGGGAFKSQDGFLKTTFTGIKQANGFLYPFADSSVTVISNVSTNGTTGITTFNSQSADPQVGTPWRDSINDFGRGIIFANTSGVYSLLGGAADKISDNLDGLFANAQFNLTGNAVPSSAVATIFGIKVYFILITNAVDPFTGLRKNVLAAFDGKKWFLGSQEANLTFVATQEYQSQLTAWGTDGSTVFRMFNLPSITLVKKGMAKLWGGPSPSYIMRKQALRAYFELVSNSSTAAAVITAYIDSVQDGVGSVQSSVPVIATSGEFIWLQTGLSSAQFIWTDGGNEFIWVSGGTAIFYHNITAFGNLMGYTFSSTSPDFTINAMSMLYKDLAIVS